MQKQTTLSSGLQINFDKYSDKITIDCTSARGKKFKTIVIEDLKQAEKLAVAMNKAMQSLDNKVSFFEIVGTGQSTKKQTLIIYCGVSQNTKHNQMHVIHLWIRGPRGGGFLDETIQFKNSFDAELFYKELETCIKGKKV